MTILFNKDMLGFIIQCILGTICIQLACYLYGISISALPFWKFCLGTIFMYFYCSIVIDFNFKWISRK